MRRAVPLERDKYAHYLRIRGLYNVETSGYFYALIELSGAQCEGGRMHALFDPVDWVLRLATYAGHLY